MMNALLLFAILAADPLPPFPADAPIKLAWNHEQTNLVFRLRTNAVQFLEVPPSTVVMSGTNPPFNFSATIPGFPAGSFNLTARAVEGAEESEDSNTLPLKFVPLAGLAPEPRLTIEKPSPFKASFEGATNATYRVQGTADFSEWSNIGHATEEPPASGKFYFLDLEKRPTFFYRVISP